MSKQQSWQVMARLLVDFPSASSLTFFIFVTTFISVHAAQDQTDVIYLKMKEMCFTRREHFISNSDKATCNVSFTGGVCWPETIAGSTVVRPCPSGTFSQSDVIFRRCKEEGTWAIQNTSLCEQNRRVKSAEKQVGSNTTMMPKTSDAYSAQQLGVTLVWLVMIIQIIAIALYFYFVPLKSEMFNVHKSLLAAFVLHFTFYLLNYYNGLPSSQHVSACKAVWIFIRFFIAAEVSWLLNLSTFHALKLMKPSSTESYISFYLLFGWGFPGLITVCGFIPLIEFTVGSNDPRCWHHFENTSYMLVLQIPMTLVIMINIILVAYLIYLLVTTAKATESASSPSIRARRSAVALVVLVPVMAAGFLMICYPVGGGAGYGYVLNILSPIQGFLVCLFLVLFVPDTRRFIKRRWHSLRGGYSDTEQGERHDGIERTSTDTDHTDSRDRPAESGTKQGRQKQLLDVSLPPSNSLSRTKRAPKVEPHAPRPLKIKVGSLERNLSERSPEDAVTQPPALAWSGASIKDRASTTAKTSDGALASLSVQKEKPERHIHTTGGVINAAYAASEANLRMTAPHNPTRPRGRSMGEQYQSAQNLRDSPLELENIATERSAQELEYIAAEKRAQEIAYIAAERAQELEYIAAERRGQELEYIAAERAQELDYIVAERRAQEIEYAAYVRSLHGSGSDQQDEVISRELYPPDFNPRRTPRHSIPAVGMGYLPRPMERGDYLIPEDQQRQGQYSREYMRHGVDMDYYRRRARSVPMDPYQEHVPVRQERGYRDPPYGHQSYEDLPRGTFYVDDDLAQEHFRHPMNHAYDTTASRDTEYEYIPHNPEPADVLVIERPTPSISSEPGQENVTRESTQENLNDEIGNTQTLDNKTDDSYSIDSSKYDADDSEEPPEGREDSDTEDEPKLKGSSNSKSGRSAGVGSKPRPSEGWRKAREVAKKRLAARKKAGGGRIEQGSMPLPNKQHEAVKKPEKYRLKWIKKINGEQSKEEIKTEQAKPAKKKTLST